jgi:CRISPR-associated protein Csx10
VRVITYQVRLLEPALVSELAGDPNSAVAFDYLPGSVLRGVFISLYLKTRPGLNPDADLAIDEEARRWFFSGATRWLHAFPIDRLGQRSLPTPRSLHRDKNGEEQDLFDLAVAEPASTEGHQYKWERLGASFGRSAEGAFRLVRPRRQLSVHTARTRRYGRARNAEQGLDEQKGDTRGAVYRYDALAAGQTFAAAVLCPDTDAPRVKQLLDTAATGTIHVGKSQTSGYGLAQIEQVSQPRTTWMEYAWPECLQPDDEGKPPAPISDTLVVRLLSDVLLRDETTGQETVEAEALCRLLANKLSSTLTRQAAFVGRAVLGGFNRKWGLPLPQTQAVAAGSVLTIKVSDLDPQKLIDLMTEGIGARRAEGFGRLAFECQLPATLTADDRKQEFPASAINLSNTADAELAARVSRRILRQRLERRVTATALKFQVTGELPRNSQLARLRGLVQEALMQPAPNLVRVKEFIAELEKRKSTRQQFKDAKVGDEALDKWLLAQLDKTGVDDWRNFFYESAAYPVVRLGGIESVPTEQMRQEYLLRWLAAFLQRLTKQKGD